MPQAKNVAKMLVYTYWVSICLLAGLLIAIPVGAILGSAGVTMHPGFLPVALGGLGALIGHVEGHKTEREIESKMSD